MFTFKNKKDIVFSLVLLAIFFVGLFYTFSSPTKSKVDSYVSNKLNWNEVSIKQDPQGFMRFLVQRQYQKIEDLAEAEFRFRTNNEILEKRIRAAEIRYKFHKEKFLDMKKKYLDISRRSENDPGNARLLSEKVSAERAFKKIAGKLKTEASMYQSASSLLERNSQVLHKASMRAIAEQQVLAEIKSSQEISKLNSLTNKTAIEGFSDQDELIASAKILGEMLQESFNESNELIGSIHGLEMDSDEFLEEILNDDFANKEVSDFYSDNETSTNNINFNGSKLEKTPLKDAYTNLNLPDLDSFVISSPEARD